MLANFTDAQNNAFTIQGKLRNAKSAKVYLYIADVMTNTTGPDSAAVTNGKFTI